MRYFASIIGVVVCFVLLCFTLEEGGIAQMLYMADGFTLGIMLLMVITTLVAAGLHKDFVYAFQLALSKKENDSLLKLKRAKEAVSLASKAVIGGGVLSASIGVVETFSVKLHQVVPANLSVSILGIVYAAFFCLLLIPIQAKLKVKIMEYMEE